MASQHAGERTASLLRATGLSDSEIVAALIEKLGLTPEQATAALRAISDDPDAADAAEGSAPG